MRQRLTRDVAVTIFHLCNRVANSGATWKKKHPEHVRKVFAESASGLTRVRLSDKLAFRKQNVVHFTTFSALVAHPKCSATPPEK